MSDYAFVHEGKAYTPNQTAVDAATADERNKALEASELEWLRTGPDRLFLYVGYADKRPATIQTWLGTVVSTSALFGPVSRFACFGPFPSERQSIDCRIFGVRYVGWYFKSSGQYCRLRKSKVQR